MASLEGKIAPDFELEGSDGTKHALRDYAGKTLVIYFYPKDNTPGCTKEACGFRDVHNQLEDMDVALLGVSKDSMKSHDKFIRDFGLPFTLLSDPEAKMMEAYGAFGEKVMYGKKTMGTIRSTVVIGPDGTVARHWQTVKKAEEHPAEVLEFLRGLK
ncbi:MAG TPA: peroxiredoxin [Geobacteraceae bacterium]|nr:peroxiredoxin [Geobacteraceae bacterium]